MLVGFQESSFPYQQNIGHIRRSTKPQVKKTDWLISQKIYKCTRGGSEIGSAEESGNQETEANGRDAKTYKENGNDERVRFFQNISKLRERKIQLMDKQKSSRHSEKSTHVNNNR